MIDNLPNRLGGAIELIGAGRLTDATVAIQRMLGGLAEGSGAIDLQSGHEPPFLDGVAERINTTRHGGTSATPKQARTFLGKIRLRDLVRVKPNVPSASVTVPEGAQFLASTFSNEAGSRPYKLYVPSGYSAGKELPLIVMLHGCTQSPDDFAVGTRMNDVAEERNILVVYPAQICSANMHRCWNWFNEEDQRRGAGEPSLIAGITRQVMADYTVDRKQVFIAGLSAGGAAAMIMGDTYPDIYAAVGVHSGLACGAARDMPSAFNAMRHGAPGSVSGSPRRTVVPTIVFHGDGDTTVNPRNGDAIVAQSVGGALLGKRVDYGQVVGGHSYRRTVGTDAAGRAVIEQWIIHGAAHAWAGGSPAGSYTDPHGPDATREMVRFFLESEKM